MAPFFNDLSCRNSHEIGLRAINLWVDAKYDENKASFIAETLKKA